MSVIIIGKSRSTRTKGAEQQRDLQSISHTYTTRVTHTCYSSQTISNSTCTVYILNHALICHTQQYVTWQNYTESRALHHPTVSELRHKHTRQTNRQYSFFIGLHRTCRCDGTADGSPSSKCSQGGNVSSMQCNARSRKRPTPHGRQTTLCQWVSNHAHV